MALTVVTGSWMDKRVEYADPFLRSFHQFWPRQVALEVFTDKVPQIVDLASSHPTGRCVQVRPLPTAWWDFVQRHSGDPVKCGRIEGPDHAWKPRAKDAGYNFRFDAVRFAGQAFAPAAAAAGRPDGEVICWLDADVVAHKQIPAGWVDGLIGDTDGAYLGREPKHSEIGFWAVRLNPGTRAMLEQFAKLYATDGLFSFKEWHSAYVWDRAREWAQVEAGVRMHNLTPGGSGHVWHQSPLRHYTDHLKGARKQIGRSPERRE